MKREKHLFDQVCTFENLLHAAHKAQRGKRFLPAVAAFNRDLEWELLGLQRQLKTQTYRPGPYRTFAINDPKPRLISAAPYRDRVVHHALCNVVEPIFERRFISDSYACRKGKGTHAAADRLSHFLHSADYALQCDIRKYFPSVDHAILKSLLRRKIGCPHTLWLIDLILDRSNPQELVNDYFAGDDLLTPLERRKGLPIGNQTSQFFANVTLDPLDHFIKEELGCRRYLRYCDDFVLLEDDPTLLWHWKHRIERFLGDRLRLRLHAQKQQVMPVTCGIDFVGYRIFPTHRRLRPDNGWRFARRLRQMQARYRTGRIGLPQVRQRIMAWLGHARHADTHGLSAALLSRTAFRRA